MNKSKIALILGLMCIVLTCGIVVQVRTIKGTGSTISTNSQENELRDAVLKAKEKYDNLYADVENTENKLEEERTNATQNNTELTDLENEIKNYNKVLGMSEVTGNGITITINDNQDIALSNWLADPNLLIVHDADLISVVNELKNAGAEAISINGERLINTTSITCAGNVAQINGEKVGAPFIIKAIGNSETLYEALNRPGGYIELLNESGIVSNIKKSNNITIEKYNGTINFNYLKDVK